MSRPHPCSGRPAHGATRLRHREQAGAVPSPAPPGRTPCCCVLGRGASVPPPRHPAACTHSPCAPGGLPSPSGPPAGSRQEPEPKGGDARVASAS